MLSMSFYYTTFTSRVVLSFHLSVKQHVQGPHEIPIPTLPPLSSSSHMAKQLWKKRIVHSRALSTVDDSEHNSTVEKIPQQVVHQCGKKSKTLDSKSTSAVTSGSGGSQSKELTNQNRESKDQGGDPGSKSNDNTNPHRGEKVDISVEKGWMSLMPFMMASFKVLRNKHKPGVSSHLSFCSLCNWRPASISLHRQVPVPGTTGKG